LRHSNPQAPHTQNHDHLRLQHTPAEVAKATLIIEIMVYVTCHATCPIQQRLTNCLSQGALWQVKQGKWCPGAEVEVTVSKRLTFLNGAGDVGNA
jgi:hypothetical protein